MPKCDIKCKINIAWWFRYLYLPGLKLFCLIHGTQPDFDRVEYYLTKALKVKVVK